MCKIDGCKENVFANGFCHSHYDLDRLANGSICVVVGCGSPVHAKGMCNKHYRRELYKTKPECKVPDCTNKIVAHGLCDMHRIRMSRHGHLQNTRPEDWGKREKHSLYLNWCTMRHGETRGKVSDRWEDFWKFVEDVGERPSKNHILARKDVHKNFGKDNYEWKLYKKNSKKQKPVKKKRPTNREEYNERVREKRKKWQRKSNIKRLYGITDEIYEHMLKEQNGVCSICGNKETRKNVYSSQPARLAIDHNHETGEVRGLLCRACNHGIGNFKDSKDILLKAIEYLDKFN